MNIEEIIEYVEALDGILALRPQPGDGSPEISWGDVFFYYAPDGVVPKAQPFATIVTKDYPDDQASRLDRPDTFRLNVSTTTAEFLALTGHEPKEPPQHDAAPALHDSDPARPDTAAHAPDPAAADPAAPDPAAPDPAAPDPAAPDPAAADVVFAHPVYGSLGWLCVVNPGPRTTTTVQDLLRTAHERARARHQRRQDVDAQNQP